MNIRVKMIANYRMALPPEAKNGIVELDVPDGATVYDAISRFDIPLDDESVIVLNGLTVDLSTPLREGDTVTAFSAIAGGCRPERVFLMFETSFFCTRISRNTRKKAILKSTFRENQ